VNRTPLARLVVERGLAADLKEARAWIMAGRVKVDGRRFDKPGMRVHRDAAIEIEAASIPFVSRGGVKLAGALDAFGLSVKAKTFLDIGASTGGFTDCLLQRGASKVYAVDAGYGLLHWRLRNNPAVVSLERTNIRVLRPEDIPDPIRGVVIDVSLFRIGRVLEQLPRLLPLRADVIALVKPQFELSRKEVGPGGVVRDADARAEAIAGVKREARDQGFRVKGETPSPLPGAKGNLEHFLWLEYPGPGAPSSRKGDMGSLS